MRLIDADLLQENLAKEPMESRTYLRSNEIVVDSPTAYGADEAVERLKHYEDLELKLQKVYGECDGLLEESIQALIEHAEQLKIGKPVKSRILTDDDVDRWLRWKELNEKGKLIEIGENKNDKNEAIDILKEFQTDKPILEMIYGKCHGKALNMAIQALTEIQKYREIGTVEECREAREKQIPKKYERGCGKDVRCPMCHTYTTDIYEHRYCTYCGQKLE